MKDILIIDKHEFLDKNFFFTEIPEVIDKMICLHCSKRFFGGTYKVFIYNNEEYICCLNEPECDGIAIA